MKKTSITLSVFILMNFVITMTAFVFNGILDKVAISLNISVANSGLLNTMYSYGAAFGVPITLILFRKIERIKMLKIILFITILMTLALVFAQNFVQLLIIRLAMGISANSYGALAISTVLSLSAKGRQGRTMSFLIMGSSLALVIGIPLTRLLSSLLDWRSIFWILNIIMILSLIYFQRYLPEGDHESTKLNLKTELKYFKDGKTSLIIIYSTAMFIGYGAFYNYVTPYLLILFPSIETMMSIILVILGIASFTGNLIGGYVSDRIGYVKSLLLGAVLQLVFMLLIFVSQPVKWLCIFFVILWLMSTWFTGLQLNTGIAQVTQNKSNFMISINSSAIQLGTAIGSSLAAIRISISGIQSIIFITLLTSLIIIVIQLISIKKYS
ncbi:DHA1 family putative efflux transporter-like MFS transporter [Clostridium saccharoperbutylacetonicum]|uniref:Arabinose efflux permease family protein n=1 Tax=Clostridium saccharoperbutylacetonicum N1-4(HMT) TaxID=931276 RepID=M1MPM2_9CLOT|nr:MFS transporter [Clostridium saccharoperbutylacetonicum]AGF56681.1 arabinose efflux permease family protein [Clostridium saccharoperbutylacetonicum N1-4(HMT)]NRT62564.1 DHA1 family putative efflux transporter-like MFS transporter [Clostridium saccharoperbutylacetonicum]NSB25912.1 DHA1 family putative efflux transporter-like MFS transporter [Clostridium saccharoperbutylacetonicum]NSB45270.1 DHA1 family putative efflux transporter-like MFS transporter [Clostridium saccharoperbutylacetonicum]